MTDDNARLTRRTTLSVLAAATGLAASGLRPALATPLVSPDQALIDRVLRIFSNPHDARRVGFSCCAQEGYSSQNGLVESIFGSGRHRLAAVSDAEVHGWLQDKIRQDFTEGRTVRVGGWVLSGTEAQVYALASMT
jgi:hypothetical protein